MDQRPLPRLSYFQYFLLVHVHRGLSCPLDLAPTEWITLGYIVDEDDREQR
jgi:hypothetical protein